MTRTVLISVACIALVAFVGACNPDSKSEVSVRKDTPKKSQKVKPAQTAGQTKKKMRTQRMSDRERYEAYASTRIRDYESRLEEMKTRAMHSSGRSKRLAERNIKELQNNIHDAHAQYGKLENAKGKQWATAKEQMDKSLENMDEYSR